MPREREDYRQLTVSHHQRLVGWFRARVGDRHTAEDLAQRTWVDVLERIRTFKPERGSFWTFTKIWAQFVLRRHYAEAHRLWPLAAAAEPADGEFDDLPNALPAARGGSSEPSSGVPNIDEILHASEVLLELLGEVLSCKRLPHEVLVFGYVKLLQWKPARVVAELSESPLDRLAEQLAAEYFHFVPLPQVTAAFTPLRANLARRLRDCDTDPRAKEPFEHLLDRVTGTSCLGDYYPPAATRQEAVTRWWAAVQRAVQESALRRSTGPLAESLRDRRILRSARGSK
jgi:DNA-directed RNA polymerase specialized sigma24 family protein